MSDHISREDALSLVKAHNKEPFHIQHALTVEGVMRWFAQELGFGDDADFWGVVGLLHDRISGGTLHQGSGDPP